MKNYNDIYDAKQMVCDMMNTAYNKGYDKAYNDRKIEEQFADDREKAIKEAYQKGLDDAWKCARKVPHMLFADRNGIFGTEIVTDIFNRYSALEAITKIKEYEEKQKANEKIKVGDEVVRDGGFTVVVTRVHGKKYVAIVYDDGSCDNNVLKEKVKKTGRHFDVQNIFDQMNDEQ